MRACGMQVHLRCGCALVATDAKHPRSSPLGMAIARPGRPTCRSSTPPMAILSQPPNRAQPASADPRGGCGACLGPSPDTRRSTRLPASGRRFAYTHTRPWDPAAPLQLQLACTPKPPTDSPAALKLQMPRIARCVPAGVGAGDITLPIRIPRLRAGTPGLALSMAGWLSTADTGPRRGRRAAAPALPLAG